MNIYVYVYMYSPRYTRVIKLSKSSSSMLSGSAANFRTVVAVPIFVHVSPPSPLSQQSCIEIFREASGHSGLRETYRGSTESEGHGFFEMAARRYPREQRERRNTQDEEDKGGENRRKRGREERRRRRGRGEGGEEEKQKRDLGRPRGSLGLPNWLRKCNGDFYNVRIYTPSYELRTFIYVCVYIHSYTCTVVASSSSTFPCHPWRTASTYPSFVSKPLSRTRANFTNESESNLIVSVHFFPFYLE